MVVSAGSSLTEHQRKWLRRVGCELVFKPLPVGETNHGSAFANGKHPGEQFGGLHYLLFRQGECRRARGEHGRCCNILQTPSIFSPDHQHSPYNILINLNIEDQGDLVGDALTTEVRISAFHLDDC